MAQQADGTVYIDTLLDTTGFKAGGKDVEAAVRRMSKTVSGIGATAKIALQKQTDAFVKANQAYAQQEQKVESLKNKLKEMSEQKVATDEFKEIGKQIDNDTAKLNRLEKAQEEFLAVGGKESSTAYRRREMQIEELRNSIRYAKGEQEDLLQSGGAYRGVDTSATEQHLADEQQRLQQMNAALGTSYQSIRAKVESLGGSSAQVSQNFSRIGQAAISAFQSAANGASRLISAAKGAAKAIGSSLLSALKRAGAAAGNLFASIGKAAASMLKLHRNTSKSNGSLGTSLKSILKYTLGIRSLYTLFNRMRGAIKDGFSNLAQYSSATNASISSLMSALTQLKNTLATAFNPILTAVAPALTSLINMVSTAITYVGMLIAALTGQSTYTKAIGVQQDYAASLGGTANAARDAAGATKEAEKATDDYLSGLDEIRRWESPDKDSSSGGGGGAGGGGGELSPSDMFEEVPIEGGLQNLAERLKEAWKNADFTDIGELLGTKLRDALDSIPWDKIKETAVKVGKSLATLINGAVETSGLDDSVGKTAGELLNTGLQGASAFVTNLHWDSVGTFIADAMNSAINTVDWTGIGNLIADSLNGVVKLATTWANKFDFKELANSVSTALNTAINGISWKSIGEFIAALLNGVVILAETWNNKFDFSNLGGSLATAINTAINGISWSKFGSVISKGLNGVFKLAETWSEKFDFDALGSAVKSTVKSVLNNIEWKNAISFSENVGKGIATAFNKIITKDTLSSIGTTFASVVNTVISGAHSSIGTIKWGKWGSAIATSINNFFTGTNWEELGVTFSDAAKGLLSLLKEGISGISWSEVGYSIADMLEKIEWEDILKAAADVVVETFKGLLDFGSALLEGFDSNEWTEFNRQIDKTLQSLKDTNDELETRIENAKNWKDAGDEYDYAEDLADKYFDLAEKEKKTNEETKEMKELAKKLVQTIPDLEEYYNSETGLLDTTRTSVDNLIESLKAKARTEAAQDALKDFCSAQLDAKKAMDEAGEKAKELNEHYEEQKGKYDDLTKKIEEATKEYGIESGEVYNLVGQQASYKEEMIKTEKKLGEVNEELGKSQKAYDEAGAEIDKITGYLVEMNDEAGTSNTKFSALNETLSKLPKDVQVKVNAVLQDDSLTLEEKKIKVAGIVTGLEDGVPLTQKKIDQIWAGVTGLEDKIALENKVINGVGANASNIQVADKNVDVKANSKKAYLADKDVNVKANAPKTNLDDKNVSVKATASKTNLTNKNVSVKATSTRAYLTNKNVSVNAQTKSVRWSYNANKTLSGVIATVSRLVKGYGAQLSLTGSISFNRNQIRADVKKSGGLYYGGHWHNIAAAASGGAFNIGQMFVAREAGPELVGTIGGHTAVMNNDQIVASVAAGVYKAVVAAFGRLNNYFVHMSLALSKLPDALQSMQVYQPVTAPIPVMASGSVIPPQTIRSSDSAELQQTVTSLNNLLDKLNVPKTGTGLQNMTIRIPVILNGRQVFEAVIDEAKMKQMVSGRNPFEMG